MQTGNKDLSCELYHDAHPQAVGWVLVSHLGVSTPSKCCMKQKDCSGKHRDCAIKCFFHPRRAATEKRTAEGVTEKDPCAGRRISSFVCMYTVLAGTWYFLLVLVASHHLDTAPDNSSLACPDGSKGCFKETLLRKYFIRQIPLY